MSTRHIAVAAAVVAIAGFGFVGPASAVHAPAPGAVVAAAVDGELEKNLQFMREEERLAHELYTLFAERYPEASIFANIARSEQRHMDAVGRQLDLYDIADPGAGLESGDYAYDELDRLYDTWSGEGSTRDGAIQAGIDLEAADIADLERILALESSEPAERVLSALLAGSENHLAAFTSASANDGVCTECDGDQSQKALAKRNAMGNGPWQDAQRRGNGDVPGEGFRGEHTRAGTPRRGHEEATS